jgi:hypothetical protein
VDECNAQNAICIIEGGTGSLGWSDPGACSSPPPGVFYTAQMPANMTSTFVPNPAVGCPFDTTQTIQVQAQASPGVYQESVIANGTRYKVGTPYGIQVLCSNDLNLCPILELTDSSGAILSSPAPTPTTVDGRQVNITMGWKPGSGTSSSYTLSNPVWTLPAQATASYQPVKGPPAATPVPFVPAPLATTVAFFFIDPSKDSGIGAEATLTSPNEVADVVTGTIYNILYPTVSMNHNVSCVRWAVHPGR